MHREGCRGRLPVGGLSPACRWLKPLTAWVQAQIVCGNRSLRGVLEARSEQDNEQDDGEMEEAVEAWVMRSTAAGLDRVGNTRLHHVIV
jgi:hypothetical protein